jgi:dCTP deaminase
LFDFSNYQARPGRLSDLDIAYLCVGENPMISPFSIKQLGKPSHGLSSSGYDLRLGKRFLRESAIYRPVEPLCAEDQDSVWHECFAEDFIEILPGECILTETVEYIDMPSDIVAFILGKSTYARNCIHVNATPVEPQWKGIITLEINNMSLKNSVYLYVGQGIAQMCFERIANPPIRGYDERESGGGYQDQRKVTTSAGVSC